MSWNPQDVAADMARIATLPPVSAAMMACTIAPAARRRAEGLVDAFGGPEGTANRFPHVLYSVCKLGGPLDGQLTADLGAMAAICRGMGFRMDTTPRRP